MKERLDALRIPYAVSLTGDLSFVKNDEIALLKIERYPEQNRPILASVLRVLGNSGSLHALMRATAEDHGFATELPEAVEEEARRREAHLRHWCARCRKVVGEEEARRSIDRYGKPYCHHCLQEKEHEDAQFTTDVEEAKRLRTFDEVAVQSRGERRIGDWLAAKGLGAQALLTGEVRHHNALAASMSDFVIFDGGHYGTEAPLVPGLAEYLQNRINGVQCNVRVYPSQCAPFGSV